MILIERLASANLIAAYAVVLGGLGLLIAGFRTLAVLVMLPEAEGTDRENLTIEISVEPIGWRLFWIGGVAFLLFMGLFPDWFVLWAENMPLAFPTLTP
jgi:hypothetical protein